jgi:hypothetical protein
MAPMAELVILLERWRTVAGGKRGVVLVPVVLGLEWADLEDLEQLYAPASWPAGVDRASRRQVKKWRALIREVTEITSIRLDQVRLSTCGACLVLLIQLHGAASATPSLCQALRSPHHHPGAVHLVRHIWCSTFGAVHLVQYIWCSTFDCSVLGCCRPAVPPSSPQHPGCVWAPLAARIDAHPQAHQVGPRHSLASPVCIHCSSTVIGTLAHPCERA